MENGGRTALQWTFGVLAAIPFASGLTGMIGGPAALRDGSTIGATVDSEYRFVNAFWLAAAPLIWRSLPRIEEQGAVLRPVACTVLAGGVGRLLAWRRSGRPPAAMAGAIALELVGMPLLLAWHRRVAERTPERS